MMTSSSTSSDDLSIQLRVRHSKHAINRGSEEQEMKCILRKFSCGNKSPVILLSSLQVEGVSNDRRASSFTLIPLKPNAANSSTQLTRTVKLAAGVSERFHSFGSIPIRNRVISDDSGSSASENPARNRSGAQSRNEIRAVSRSMPMSSLRPKAIHVNRVLSDGVHPSIPKPNLNGNKRSVSSGALSDLCSFKTFTITATDITLVDIITSLSNNDDSTLIRIITKSTGYFEFRFDSRNSHDLMVAFLKSSLPSSSFSNKGTSSSRSEHPYISLCASSEKGSKGSTFDMDNFTAKEMNHWVKTETISEKLRRRANMLSSKVNEITVNFVDCVPCACGSQTIPSSPIKSRDSQSVRSPPKHAGISRHQMILSYEAKSNVGIDDARDGLEIGTSPSDEKKENRSIGSVTSNDSQGLKRLSLSVSDDNAQSMRTIAL